MRPGARAVKSRRRAAGVDSRTQAGVTAYIIGTRRRAAGVNSRTLLSFTAYFIGTRTSSVYCPSFSASRRLRAARATSK